jgi:hypothetical protein
VPPIFQPEVAAEAIVYAASHRRRELIVGWPAVKAVYGEKVAPGLLDRVLARIGYDKQQTDEPLRGEREGNLFEPVPGDYSAHGTFDDQAKSRSLLFELDRRRGPIAVAAGLSAIAAAVLRPSGRRSGLPGRNGLGAYPGAGAARARGRRDRETAIDAGGRAGNRRE